MAGCEAQAVDLDLLADRRPLGPGTRAGLRKIWPRLTRDSVINVLGAGVRGLHVEGGAVPLPTLLEQVRRGGLKHSGHGSSAADVPKKELWLRKRFAEDGYWPSLREYIFPAAELENILAEIHGEAGGVTLHHMSRAAAGVVSPFLERESLRSMIGEHDTLEADAESWPIAPM